MPKTIEGGADAFLFATNMISIACLYTIKDLGQEVINRIGLVGFDGTPAFDFFSAPISYVQQPAEVLVQKALEILIDNIANGNTVQSVLAGRGICRNNPLSGAIFFKELLKRFSKFIILTRINLFNP